jgi:hypothetical protein
MSIHAVRYAASPVSEFASISQIARHLRVHRNTAAELFADDGLQALAFRKMPVFAWIDVWVRLEGVPRQIARDARR